jgi:hypothetical protein
VEDEGDFMNTRSVWKVMILWFVAVVCVLAAAGEWSVVVFAVTYGLGFGGICYVLRKRVRKLFVNLHLKNYGGFLAITVLVTVGEEVYCYALGNRIAHPVLWIDLIMVTVLWSVWCGTWYFLLSKWYWFREEEALLAAGCTGVSYEFVGTGAVLENPGGILLATPLAVVVYAAIFVLPLQLMDFSGTRKGVSKYIVGIFLPFVLTVPVALGLYVVFSVLGI